MAIQSCRGEKKKLDLVSDEVRASLRGYYLILGKLRVQMETRRNMHNLAMQIAIPTMKQPVSDQNLSSSPYYMALTDQSLAPHTLTLSSGCTISPYYKGLIDNSLAIPPHNHPILPNYSLSSGYTISPYYKGLIENSLAIPPHKHPILPNHSLSCRSTPYYKGLMDNSLALRYAPLIEGVYGRCRCGLSFRRREAYEGESKKKSKIGNV
ncbi:hypothetical protein CR513_46711, partial [Mucuna pruriens]